MSAEELTTTENDRLPIGRLGRLIVLIAFVSAVFLFAATSALPSELLSIAAVVIGTVAIFTAMVGFLISVASYVDE